MMGAKTLKAQIADGTAKAEGNTEILDQLASALVVFDPRFEILPGTKGPGTPEDLSDDEYGAPEVRGNEVSRSVSSDAIRRFAASASMTQQRGQ